MLVLILGLLDLFVTYYLIIKPKKFWKKVMSKDRIFRLAGVILIIIAVLMLALIPDISKIGAVAAGVLLGLGFGLISDGENAFAFWKSNN